MKSKATKPKTDTPIAIIGMGCFFPKSSGLNEYWRLINQGRNGITDIPDTHWSVEDYYHQDPKKEDHVYCRRGGFLSPVMFDPTEFGIPPNTIEATDTSQLLGLMAAKAALDDSGYGSDKPFNRERTSVILGVTGTQELVIPLSTRLGHPKWRKALLDSGVSQETTERVVQQISDSYVKWQENSFPGLLGNVVAGRISNRLDLGGTNCVVDAACASSLGAIHMALLELSTRQSDMVITGGIDTLNDIFMHMCFSKTYVLSPTGDSRPFSRSADGTVLGEGIGLLVLKRLADAKKDKDRIYAVIRGMGASSDGKSQSIYAPRADGQAKALGMAYKKAGVSPTTVELVEAHGTGTRVGDLVEFTALKKTFTNGNHPHRKCALGSVKSMIGHTKAAAGSAGLIKTALSLYHKVLPPTIKADDPDPKLEIHNSPFYLNNKTRPWFRNHKHPRRSGVSAFGFGGSNFHMVLEEYGSNKSQVAWDGSIQIFGVSADSQEQILDRLREWAKRFKTPHTGYQVAIEAHMSRKAYTHEKSHRFLMVLDLNRMDSLSLPEYFNQAVQTLENKGRRSGFHTDDFYYGVGESSHKLAFVFPGQGSQYLDMGRHLMCTFPEAFEILQQGNHVLTGDQILSDFIYPIPEPNGGNEDNQSKNLRNTRIAQPALGAVSLGILKILDRFNVKPDAACGHSFGELVALHAAGCYSEETLLKLAAARGEIMASLSSRGSMLAAMAPLEKIERVVSEHGLDVTVANRNAPSQCVLSGTMKKISDATGIFSQHGIKTAAIPVSAAFHSPLVAEAKDPFLSILKNVRFKPAKIPVYSNSTGRPYPKDRKNIIDILGNHILKPVDFISNIKDLYQNGIQVFVEVGPKTILSGLIRSILKDRDHEVIPVDASSGRNYGVKDLASTLCRLASLGHAVNLKKWENTHIKPQKQGMSIPITGANQRVCNNNQKPRPKNARPPEGTDRYSQAHTQESGRAFPDMEKQPLTQKTITHAINHEMNNQMSTMNHQPNKEHQDFISQALSTVQEGLKSIQNLQKQTAVTHEKFLESQQEASRTLQAMMDSTQRLAEATMGLPATSPTVNEQAPTHSKMQPQVNPASIPKTREVVEQKFRFSDHSGTDSPARETAIVEGQPSFHASHPQPAPESKNMEPILLDIVSNLTGYPVDMLGLDMDIEADLGIDSIKRVEILSALEEKIPDLPALSPDIMGSMKTLAQIVSHISTQTVQMDTDLRTPGNPHEPKSPAGVEKKTAASPRVSTDALESVLLETVSHLTGYPIDMLGLDMDIEADLGIDSIKRVEILSLLEEKIPNLPSVSPDIMGTLKTLAQIVDYLGSQSSPDPMPDRPEGKEPAPSGLDIPAGESNVVMLKDHGHPPHPGTRIDRQVVTMSDRPFQPGPDSPVDGGRKVFIIEDRSGLAKAVSDELETSGVHTVLISSDILKYKKEFPQAGGVILVSSHETRTQSQDIQDLFSLTRHFGPQLTEAAGHGNAFFASITRLDGAFGFNGAQVPNPIQGALAGLVKTAALEWEGVTCRAFDVDPKWQDVHGIARAVTRELMNPDVTGSIEIGLGEHSRKIPELTHSEFTSDSGSGPKLTTDDVVLITGGARGITAACARALAEKTKSTLILLGRSPEPYPEPDWLNSLETDQDIKKAIYENEFNNQMPSPRELALAHERHMANREIALTLEMIKQTGAGAHYYPLDICDAKKVNALISEVVNRHGTVKALIHGAGVLEDRLIMDKTPEQFKKVFDTKISGLENMLSALDGSPLEYLVLFSSVSSRMGNQGQSDYAMANEAMNKLALNESVNRPDCKVVSINWGPWDGGMVTESLKKEFLRKEIPLIPLEQGARSMVLEMAETKSSDIEVVIGGLISQVHSVSSDDKSSHDSIDGAPDGLSLSFKREINVETYPILRSHQLNGKPVVPLALMNEWFGHGALHENPGLVLHGLDHMRVLQGIKLDQGNKTIRLLSGKARKQGNIYEVDVELRDGIQEKQDVIHTRGKAILTDRLSPAPPYTIPEKMLDNGFQKSAKEVYDKILFHGSGLHGIEKIIHLSSMGMVARISSAPKPDQWIKNPLRNKWISDPLILDCAFQMATVWCYDQLGLASLPSYYESYRQYRTNFPENGTRVVLTVKQSDSHKMIGEFTFLDSNDEVIAQIKGYEAIMDASLKNAFKPMQAVNE